MPGFLIASTDDIPALSHRTLFFKSFSLTEISLVTKFYETSSRQPGVETTWAVPCSQWIVPRHAATELRSDPTGTGAGREGKQRGSSLSNILEFNWNE